MIHEVQVEATFPGRHQARHRPRTYSVIFTPPQIRMIPGEIIVADHASRSLKG